MSRLTERRLEKALPILERYRDELRKTGSIEPIIMERELAECWKSDYKGMKDIFIDMSFDDDFKYIAIYYMQHQAPDVVREFQDRLASVYGLSYWHFNAELRECAARIFWDEFKRENGTK